LEDAESWFKASLSSKPDHVPAHLTYANLLAQKGLYDAAASWYTKALELEPENKEIYKHYSKKFLYCRFIIENFTHMSAIRKFANFNVGVK